jgi:hypothetical protein
MGRVLEVDKAKSASAVPQKRYIFFTFVSLRSTENDFVYVSRHPREQNYRPEPTNLNQICTWNRSHRRQSLLILQLR